MAESSAAAASSTTEVPRTQEKVQELQQAAALQYSLKNFGAASDLYADAVEIQAELNGEMAPDNAELLFYYGRALYKVAISKSDVLGSKVASEEKGKPKSEKKTKKSAGEGSSSAANGASEKKEETVESKPYFQLTGDENWTDSEDEDEDAEGGEGEEGEDDFQNAFETFEIARVLYSKQLEALGDGESADKGKGKAELTTQARTVKEKIADCHGFLVEIALENERFHDAVSDAQAHLALQEELHPFEHENITEAHYTLSLALEFASTRKAEDASAGDSAGAAPGPEGEEQEIDYKMREEAAKQTELAVQSLTARLSKETEALTSGNLTDEQKKEKEAIIKDKKDVLEDMKTRLADLKTDPKAQALDSIDPSVFQGLLGGLLGADAATQKAKIEEATKSANDISGLVKTRKKEKAPAPAPTATSSAIEGSSGKRKLEVEDDTADGKRAKTEEPQ
ncbi:hypothetical protein BU24DRAFT_375360 [Aaosphaeria arxii CBS 175.79]|uniref:Tetratricopeptide SHNi-TPR domain-containing protein n=1 Tax=Aaosphaeria arxii CBS 175.79 TaxID=1450172 RepID=A0A6A5XGG7_9PLEO|nr:uncharacterized protein BU24DRAFT_375360 [Aaosphaeria arxii CBS 175.79]KAF2012010.1 hypothetical protein BU24DRAFT_375360 [Aaosphaeria arxii CBS 175.79]